MSTAERKGKDLLHRNLNIFSRLTTLCTHLLWMRIASAAAEELHTAFGYVIKCSFLN